jgi:DNA-directed RNA polymerase specialized sigma24 family protein
VTSFDTLQRSNGPQAARPPGDNRALIDALARLPIKERRCLELRLNGHLSTERIAAKLQLPAGSVRRLQLSALRLLTHELASAADTAAPEPAAADPF